MLETKLRPPDRRPGRAAGAPGRGERAAAHPGERPGGLGEDHARRRLARRPGRRRGRVGGARRGRQRPGALLALRRRGPPPRRGAGRGRGRRGLSGAGETVEAGLSALINGLADAEGRTLLALDDYHLIGDEGIHVAVAFLCANAPEGLREVIMTSRSDPPIGLSRLRARGDLAEIRAPDLRFSDDDARALLAEAELRSATTRSPACASARRAGPPASTWPACPSGDARTPAASSPTSPATTAWSWTTWPTRCWRGCRPTAATSCCAPRC